MRYLVVRSIWRACVAPLVQGSEQRLTEEIQARRKRGEPLTLPPNTPVRFIDRLFEQYGEFAGKKLVFLRTISMLAYTATRRFLGEVANDRAHPCWPMLTAGYRIHPEYFDLSQKFKGFKTHHDFLNHLRQLAVTPNVTTLNLLYPAAEHAHLWSGNPDLAAVLLERIEELGWTQSVSTGFFDRYFPNQTVDHQLPPVCPFTGNAAHIAGKGSIWSAPSLCNGPWERKRYCPANVPDLGNGVTAATARLISGIHVAEQTLWTPNGSG